MPAFLFLFIIILSAFHAPASAQTIGPLLKTEWHQYDPYNRLCPEIDGKRTIVGCVATSLTEIMYNYRYPQATLDTLHGWQTDKFVLPDVLPGAQLKWNDILVDYRGQYTEAQAQAIAELSLYAGMACHMNFGVGSSGADTYRYLETLPAVFGYKYVHMYDRSYYSPAVWRAMLVYELGQGHALLYTGHSQEFNGHAFVIDGYDTQTGLFHAEWGYGGAYNGWFDIDVLNPFEPSGDQTEWGRREGFFCNQSALAISPEPCEPYKADSLVLDVTLDSITVPQLALGQSCEAVFHFTNNTADTLMYTYEVLSNAPTDTALFDQADYVGLSAVRLLPHASASDPVLLRIRQSGERQLRISCDDEHLTQPMDVTIAAETPVSEVRTVCMVDVDSTSATIELQMDGKGLVTWCLFPDESMTTDTDIRHWSYGSCTVTFNGLKPSTTYVLAVRYPWTVREKITFTTPAASTPVLAPAGTSSATDSYDIAGRRLTGTNRRGIIISNGRKHIE